MTLTMHSEISYFYNELPQEAKKVTVIANFFLCKLRVNCFYDVG